MPSECQLATTSSDKGIMSVENDYKLRSTSFTEALVSKYCQQEDFIDIFCIPKDSEIRTEIAFVGFDKVARVQKQLLQLTNIDLSGKRISTSGICDEDLKKKLQNVLTLNLDQNSLDWFQLFEIIKLLPNLRELIASRNALGTGVDLILDSQRTLSSLTLGYHDTDWNTTVCTLSNIWSQIEQFDMWRSDLNPEKMELKCLSMHATRLVSSIRSLRFSHNNFRHINWIPTLGPIENLLELDLSNCKLIEFKLNHAISQILQNLRNLNISYNDLDNWEYIDGLARLKSLNSLICHENPFFVSTKQAKPFIIARLAGLSRLNREEITARARRDSEILYMRIVTKELDEAVDKERVLSKHLRYNELVNLYGKPEVSSKTTESMFMSLVLRHHDTVLTRKLPRNMRVADLKMLCKRIFKLESRSQVLVYHHSRNDLVYELDRDAQTLDFFSISEGSELVIKV